MAQLSDTELERLACEELMQEAKRGAARVKNEGSMGWLKSSQPKANKRFLQNTVVNIVMFNKSKHINVNEPATERDKEHYLELNVNGEKLYKSKKK